MANAVDGHKCVPFCTFCAEIESLNRNKILIKAAIISGVGFVVALLMGVSFGRNKSKKTD